MKSYALLTSAILVLGLAACGTTPPESMKETKKNATTTVVTAPSENCTSDCKPAVNPTTASGPIVVNVTPSSEPLRTKEAEHEHVLAERAAAMAPPPSMQSPMVMATPVNTLCSSPGAIRVSSVGYGSTSSLTGLTPGQKKLLGMRASKMDAYRAMAEQVAGVRVTGNTTLADMMAKNDGLRITVDAYVRGARVVTVTPMSDGNYETVLEVELDTQFYSAACQSPNQSMQGSPMIKSAEAAGIMGGRSANSASFYFGD